MAKVSQSHAESLPVDRNMDCCKQAVMEASPVLWTPHSSFLYNKDALSQRFLIAIDVHDPQILALL